MKPHLPHRNPNNAGGVDELAAGARTAAVCTAVQNDSLAPRSPPVLRNELGRVQFLAYRPTRFDTGTSLHLHGPFPQKAGDNLTVRNYREEVSQGTEDNQARPA